MRKQPTSLTSLVTTVSTHRNLLRRLVVREFTQRFKGSLLGLAWAVLTPLLMAAAFTFVFSTIFQARWPIEATDGKFDFALIILAGLAVHGLFAEVVSRAPTLIVGNPSYVTRVVFPLEILPMVTLVNAMLNAAIVFGIVLLGNILVNGAIRPTAVFLPLVLAPYILLLLATTMAVAAAGVFFRDLSQLVALVVSLSTFLTPIFYPVSAVPPAFRPIIFLNPLTFVVEQVRDVTLFGRMPDFAGLAVYGVVGVAALAGAFWAFQRLRPGFADVV